jgi:nucleotide-binding universal stress UspA family protein
VPLDGSPLAERAVPVACALARRWDAPVRLVHVHSALVPEPIYVEGLAVIDEHLRSQRREHERAYMQQSRRLVEGTPVEAVILEGRVAPALAAEARRSEAQLVVMTTHGRGGLERLWLGSVADELAHGSPAPLLLLRPEEGAPAPAFHRVLVAVDGSAFADSVLGPATRVAQPGAQLTLLTVVEPVAWTLRPTDLGMGVPGQAEREGEAARQLERAAEPLRSRGFDVRVRVASADHVAACILDTARDLDADLVAIATHGRSAVARAALGSVADKVVRGAHRPVLLHRPHLEAGEPAP